MYTSNQKACISLDPLPFSRADFPDHIQARNDERVGGRQGRRFGARAPKGPAKVSFNDKIDCSLGPSEMKYPRARTGSRRP